MRFNPDLHAALQAVPIPQPFDLETYLDRISEARGRPLFVLDLPEGIVGAVNGLWIATEMADHIWVAPGARGILRVLIVLHEISHMLLNHGQVGDDETALSWLLGKALGMTAIRAAGRSKYQTQEERDAERLATLILMHVNEPLDDAADGDEGMRRIKQTFGYE
ncbi:hypothetical protein ACIBI7_50430 [Nonomuraea fuscirosea]|uniref:hypothetical protein n=1 Tax=Nonomuraea fuscirosea TaxID=1291556 RepID=UPI0037A34CF3